MLKQVENHWQGFLIRNLIGIVDRRAVQIGGDAALADSLGDRRSVSLQLTGFDPGIDGGAKWIGRGDPDFSTVFFKRNTYASKRAAGADGAGESVDAALRLVPNFRSCSLDMGLAVGDIVELVGPNRATRLGLCELLRYPCRKSSHSCSGPCRGRLVPR